jgi:hypothetical protein
VRPFNWGLFNLGNPKFGLGDLDLVVTWGFYNVLNKATIILFLNFYYVYHRKFLKKAKVAIIHRKKM